MLGSKPVPSYFVPRDVQQLRQVNNGLLLEAKSLGSETPLVVLAVFIVSATAFLLVAYPLRLTTATDVRYIIFLQSRNQKCCRRHAMGAIGYCTLTYTHSMIQGHRLRSGAISCSCQTVW